MQKLLNRTAPWFMLVVLVMISNLQASQSIAITNNLESYPSRLQITSSNGQGIELAVDVSALGLKECAGFTGSFKTADLPDGEKITAGKLYDEGKPELPILSTLIAIPDKAGITVQASYSSLETIENIDIAPAQPFEVESGSYIPQPLEMDNDFYSRDSYYPEVLADAGDPMIMRDVRLAKIVIYPVHYNPVRHQLRIYHDIAINISFDGPAVNPKTQRADYMSEAFYPIYQEYIANFDAYLANLSTAEIRRGGILMITPDTGSYVWGDQVRQFAWWKRQKGYEVTVVTTADIHFQAHPSFNIIKSYLQDIYDSWENPPEYIYLFGDEDLLFNGYEMIPDYPFNYYSSDHAYTMLEGEDYLPDVILSRVSVDNINELNCWIAKALLYDKTPDITDDPEYWRRAIMVAGCNQTVTCPWTVLWTKQKLEQKGFTHIDTVFERNYNDPPDEYIINPISNGVGYVNYRGWAGSAGWYDPSFNCNNLNLCQNINKPGIMTSIVCGTGDFGSSYDDPCFGEVWIRMGSETAPRGGPCFYGTTNHNAHTRWNQSISLGFWGSFLNYGVYHFGAACVAAKMRQYVCFPHEDQTIQQYFHTYNMMGDPETEMRLTTPIVMSISHPPVVPRGVNNIEITAADRFGEPVKDAYATLTMGDFVNELFFSVARTDQSGYALLEVPTDITGNLILTVTGRDLYPFIDTISVVQANQTVGFDSYAVDDNRYGFSYGNDDGMCNPEETIELSVVLRNFGSGATAENVIAILEAQDSTQVAVHKNQLNYGNIAPGMDSDGDGAFIFTLRPGLEEGEEVTFKLEVTSDNSPEPWLSNIVVPVKAAKFMVTDITIGGDGFLDPGETAEIVVEIQNSGQLDAQNITAVLSTTDGYAHPEDINAQFGSIGVGETGDNSLTPFTINLDPETFKGRNIPLKLAFTYSNGIAATANCNITAGQISTSDPAGPDEYGYYVYDNTDSNYTEFPDYEWFEIRGQSGAVNLNMGDDENSWVHLPFEFIYYGKRVNDITVCSNGWVSMDSCQWPGFRNWPLPDPAYGKGMIAAFWDDLGPIDADNVFIYYDQQNSRFIIEWSSVTARWNPNFHESFQIVLLDPRYHPTITGDAMIEFNYSDVNNGDGGSGENYASVGWEDYSETRGFSISYSNISTPGCAALEAGRTYRITTNTGRGAIAGIARTPDDDPAGVRIEAATGQWAESSNDGSYVIRDVPPGSTDIYLTRLGYFPSTLLDIQVTENMFTSFHDAMLEACPVPQNIEASQALGDHIHVTWEPVEHPRLAGYDIYRSRWETGIFNKLNDSPLVEPGYDDYSAEGRNVYWYYVRAAYQDDRFDVYSLNSNKAFGSNEEIVPVDDVKPLPAAFMILQNYPNPFNLSTVIKYELPTQSRVTIDIYDILGRKVTTLRNDVQPAGYYQMTWNAQNLSSGMYFYKIQAGDFVETKKMILLK